MACQNSGQDHSSALQQTRRLVLAALLFAMAIVLSLVESALPALPLAAVGVRLGLSNIAVMYALFFLGARYAFAIACLKAGFVVITRAPVSGLISLCGGLLSIAIMLVLLQLLHTRVSYLMLSVCGALSHNLGQLAAVSLIYTSLNLWWYLPVLLLAGIVAGTATSVLLKLFLPALERINPRNL